MVKQTPLGISMLTDGAKVLTSSEEAFSSANFEDSISNMLELATVLTQLALSRAAASWKRERMPSF